MASVLVVDDAQLIRRMLQDTLQTAGHEVVGEAVDGEEAVRLFRELRPDLVTLDVTMPGKDGLQVLREIMQFDPQARIVMCTAVGQEPKVIEALDAGAREYVVKPFTRERVLQAIDSALAADGRTG